LKILVIADVHANLAALEAVLDCEASWDEVLFLGDAVVSGPQPEEVVSLIMRLDATAIIGNHDREALEFDPETDGQDPHLEWLRWTRNTLSAESAAWLDGLPATLGIVRDGLSMRLVHGVVPAGHGRRVWPDSPDAAFECLARGDEPTVFFAHSHVQFETVKGGRTFHNPGSVGQPRLSQPVACYTVILDGRAEMRAVPYDVERTCRAMDSMPLPRGLVEEWKSAYRRGVCPERYAIRDFAPLVAAGYR